MVPPIDNVVKEKLKEKLIQISEELDGDVFSYFGIIADGNENQILKLIEDIDNKKERIFVILTCQYFATSLPRSKFYCS